MSLRSAPASRLAAPAVGLVAVLALAACGSGQNALTYQERASAQATNDRIGAIAVRNLAVAQPFTGITHPEGSAARATATFVNEGSDPDALVSVSTPAAREVEVVGPTSRLTVPTGGSVDSYSFRLLDLTRDLAAGSYVELTLAFERNGTKTLSVPVQVNPEGAPREDLDYEVAHLDSAGKPILKKSEGGEH